MLTRPLLQPVVSLLTELAEAEMYQAKAQLKEAKQTVRSLRTEVDQLAERVSVPYKQLDRDCAEAKQLLDECMDLELELVRMKSENSNRASTGGDGGGVFDVVDLDVETTDLEVLPPVGTLTEREAERFIERQEAALIQLEDENAQLDLLMTRLSADAKDAVKKVDKLGSEKRVAERQAKEAKSMGVGGKKRDREVERICLK